MILSIKVFEAHSFVTQLQVPFSVLLRIWRETCVILHDVILHHIVLSDKYKTACEALVDPTGYVSWLTNSHLKPFLSCKTSRFSSTKRAGLVLSWI